MTELLEKPTELDQTFDESNSPKVWAIKHPASGKYACYIHNGINGLAVATHEGGIVRFAEFIDLSGLQSEELTFEEAVAVALSRPLPVIAVILVDSIQNPKIYKIR